jgi:hypothetical protein
VSPLADPPPDVRDLARFPVRTWPATRDLVRIHRREHDAWWFATDGTGRFDSLGGPSVCYLAEQPLGAFVEVFRHQVQIERPDVLSRSMSRVRVRASRRLADCTRRRARAFGITAAIHATDDHARTQAWARAFAAAGFHGIRYRLSHDPSQQLVGVALFGPVDGHVRSTTPIPDAIIAAAVAFGIRVLPTP